jgi:hypothetical protein
MLRGSKEQAEALSMMHGDILDLIYRYGAEFRIIIDEFERVYNRCPTANELVWLASEHAGHDLRKEE